MQLESILEKLGVTSPDQLTAAERKTWMEWTHTLAKRDVTIEDLKTFLPQELDRAHGELRDFKNTNEKDMFYKAYASLLENITKFITSPAKERDELIAFLKQKYKI